MDPYVTGSVSSQVGAEVESSVGVASGSSMGQASQSQPTHVSSELGAELEASVKRQLREYLTEFNDMLKEYVKLSQIVIDYEADNQEKERRKAAVKMCMERESCDVIRRILNDFKKESQGDKVKNLKRLIEQERN